MKLIQAILLILITVGSGAAQSQSKCFQFGALKDKHIFRFEADGGDVVGSYFIEREYDSEKNETYDFGGTRNPRSPYLLSIKFSTYKKLQNPPFEIRRATLTLVKTGGAETLRAKFYGGGKAPVYSIDLESCEPSYAALVKAAKRLAFAKGANSATVATSFRNQEERKAFWLGARKGQTVEVEAPGCGISFFYPDKTSYEEGTAIDTLGLKLAQTGDYLFVIKPAGEPGECRVNFKIHD